MIKLTLRKSVEHRNARCDWCGETKECATAVFPNSFSYCESQYELKTFYEREYHGSMFGSIYKPSKFSCNWWVAKDQHSPSGKSITKEKYADICGDCAGQLAILLKQVNK